MTTSAKPLGYWSCWALTVGTTIGSGIFSLPASLAPFGLMSFGGWLLTGGGTIVLALVIGRLAARTTRNGGPYAYTHDAFGDLTGFLIGWGYLLSGIIGAAAIAISLTSYLGVLFPSLGTSTTAQALTAMAAVWTFTLIAIAGAKEAGATQVITTILKLVPLVAIIGLGMVAGSTDNLPPANPTNDAAVSVLAATALLTMFAFLGFEMAGIPAASVENASTVIPRAVVSGTVVVTVLYFASTAAVMMLVPAAVLQQSASPFADAAAGFGTWGPPAIAIGALISTAGALNGSVFVNGQVAMAMAPNSTAMRRLARLNGRGAPVTALILGGVVSSALLLTNYSRGAIDAFTFLAMMTTLTSLVPYLFSAAAELKYSWRNARGWAGVAALGAIYAIFTIIGSGLEVVFWGTVLILLGLPVFYAGRRKPR